MSSVERLLYTSLATEPLGTLDLFNLLNQARERNAALGITGHLLYAKGQFTQCIEGPSACVEQLWQRLLKDHRHAEVQLLSTNHRVTTVCRLEHGLQQLSLPQHLQHARIFSD